MPLLSNVQLEFCCQFNFEKLLFLKIPSPSFVDIDLGTTVDQDCIVPATASDFSMGTYSLTLLEGTLSSTLSVTILNDNVPEERECLVASITSLDWGEGRPDQLRIHSNNTVVIPIIDDDRECSSFKVSFSKKMVGILNIADCFPLHSRIFLSSGINNVFSST